MKSRKHHIIRYYEVDKSQGVTANRDIPLWIETPYKGPLIYDLVPACAVGSESNTHQDHSDFEMTSVKKRLGWGSFLVSPPAPGSGEVVLDEGEGRLAGALQARPKPRHILGRIDGLQQGLPADHHGTKAEKKFF